MEEECHAASMALPTVPGLLSIPISKTSPTVSQQSPETMSRRVNRLRKSRTIKSHYSKSALGGEATRSEAEHSFATIAQGRKISICEILPVHNLEPSLVLATKHIPPQQENAQFMQQLDRHKLGASHEALGSHPPEESAREAYEQVADKDSQHYKQDDKTVTVENDSEIGDPYISSESCSDLNIKAFLSPGSGDAVKSLERRRPVAKRLVTAYRRALSKVGPR